MVNRMSLSVEGMDRIYNPYTGTVHTIHLQVVITDEGIGLLISSVLISTLFFSRMLGCKGVYERPCSSISQKSTYVCLTVCVCVCASR